MHDPDYEEWLSDFGGRLTAEDLERLLSRARETKDEDLRRLVKSHMTLRVHVREFLLPLASNVPQDLTHAQLSMIEMLRTWVSDTKPATDA
jgi:hypothetical protein